MTSDQLSEAIAKLGAGDMATVTWTDSSGQSRSAAVTLGEGPIG